MIKKLIQYFKSLEPALLPEQEERYRRAYYDQDMMHIKIMVVILLFLSIAWIPKELFINKLRVSLLGTELLRVSCIVAGIIYLVKQRKGHGVINRKYFMILAVLIIVHQCLIFMSRPVDYSFTSYMSLLILFFVYFVFPFSLPVRALLAASLSSFEISMIIIVKKYQPGGAVTVISIYILMNYICLVYSAKVYSTRRNNYKQLVEKEIMLKEVHHRIKNNISSIESMLVLRMNGIKDRNSVVILGETLSRIESMRVIYDKLLLKGHYAEISVKSYIEELVSSILAFLPGGGEITVTTEIDDLSLDVGKVFPLGIIINELITNSMKYAFPDKVSGAISVSLLKKSGEFVFTFQDNGKGIFEKNDINESEGFGLMLVRMLSDQLKGKLSIENSNGALFVIRFAV